MGLPQPRMDDEFPSVTSLLAENERLKRELAIARARVGELEARADIDPLLDILNRRGFERELKRALAHVKRYGTQAVLMFVDLDGFKGINDRYGHGAGDLLLKAVARELIGHVRASDIVGRIGGDEFGVLLWRLEGPQATAKARQLEAMIAKVGIPHGKARIEVAASIGVAPLVEDASPVDIIAAADQAMYARKDERRGLPAPVRWGE
jgi:diguanylate cyclase (GGDEF)-like protein